MNGDRRERRQVIVDAEGYRDRRAAALSALADRTAQKVARDSVSIALKPMTAAERKVIHLHLKDHPRVETVSEGNEPFRAVVVSPNSRRPELREPDSVKEGSCSAEKMSGRGQRAEQTTGGILCVP